MQGLLKLALCGLLFLFSSLLFAKDKGKFYVSANVGVIRSNFNSLYNDQTDVISQNIAESLQQSGYTGGIAVGYTKRCKKQYLLGFELAGGFNTNRAVYMSGAASSAFTDKIKIPGFVDLTFVPSLLLTNSFFGYIKLGPSLAFIKDQLTSPVGYNPSYSTYQSNKVALGFVAGFGLKKYLKPRLFVFGEYNFHDYGKVNFSGFQNFTASYTHSAYVYMNNVIVGVAYHV